MLLIVRVLNNDLFVPFVIVRTVLGTLEGLEESSGDLSLFLDDVYFRKVDLVIQICTCSYSTVEFGFPSVSKHNFGSVSASRCVQYTYFGDAHTFPSHFDAVTNGIVSLLCAQFEKNR